MVDFQNNVWASVTILFHYIGDLDRMNYYLQVEFLVVSRAMIRLGIV